ncbi:single-stranded-DNA-specific exonuclease RecJ [Carnobacterium divergens]|uniref:single-stranded-DNA-specific exonuclease RecJ n=1 Tax=Carnobacterium divergens TaxID=2748 RepID=UPI00107263F3|nr:single-stranded-DNA-specific exonuclease RecJ [Carnobacterium divergens]TFJ44013.1 single-stranded-DNA-specific exonuclease RecJ [Carnobacterium divergens]TFJ51090.1 single-stranded-DNA-specific exonuclease RecJ [Carnobacterium divergens]
MLKSRMNWKLNQPQLNEAAITALSEELSTSPLVTTLLVNRGLDTKDKVQHFLKPDETWIHDPFLMYDMEKTVERITQAIENGQKIIVYGDYDADGVTSTAVLKETIEMLGGEVDYYIPNRFTDGYGPNVQAFEKLIEDGAELIVTCDNGVSGHEAIAKAKELGVDVIVTDHHEMPEILPEAYSIVHPKHPKGAYPFGELAGVGVAFKLATALLGEFPTELVDLVAIGTIADLVSLTDENRALVILGLEMLKSSERLGFLALAKVAGIEKETMTEETIGFTIAPRLNAVGRLGEAAPAVALLTTFDEEEAVELATFINTKNEERQAFVAKITEEAFQMIAEMKETPSVYLLAKSDWHEGVLGIVASKIVGATGKPALVLNIDAEKGIAKGSGRSVSAYDLYDAINEVRDLTTHFGGHHMAAGLTLPIEHIEALQTQLNHYALTHDLVGNLNEELAIDETIELADITVAAIEEIASLAPFGTDNPKPVFLLEHVQTEDIRKIGGNNAHLKLKATKNKVNLDVIGFQLGAVADEINDHSEVSLVGKLSINEWNGNRKPQLMLEDIAMDGLQVVDLRGSNLAAGLWVQGAACYLFYNKKSYQSHNDKVPMGSESVLIESKEDAEVFKTQHSTFVFIDCPNELEWIPSTIQGNAPEKLVTAFFSESESYLNGMPSRTQFGELFKFVATHKDVDIRHKLPLLANYLKIKDNLLIFMINVFFELGFVTIDNGVMNYVKDAPKKELSDAENYQKRLNQIEAEKILLYSHFAELEIWLKQQINEAS